MKELMVFNNADFGQMRTVEINGKTMFCGKDVATALGYKDTTNALKSHCKKDGVAIHHLTDSLGRSQETKFISEGNVYRLIAKSKLPSAEKFESWVFDDVIPTIRKTGSYSVVQDSYLIDDPIKRAERWIEEKKHTLALEQKVAEQQPKADYYDELVDREHLTGIRDTAKELHIKERVFVKWLLDNKFLYRDAKNILKPYSTKMDLFTEKDYKNKNNTHSGVRTLITLKGKDYFRKACVDLKEL